MMARRAHRSSDCGRSPVDARKKWVLVEKPSTTPASSDSLFPPNGLRESLNQNPPSAGKRSAERKDNMTHGTRSPHFGRPTSLFGDSPYLHRARGCSGHCQRFRPTGFSSATKMIGSLNFQWTWQRRRIMPGASSRRTSERTPEGQAR
jgi:hypothetical protein